MNELQGRLHFWGSLIGMNGHLAGADRRAAGLVGADDDFLTQSQP